MDPKSFAIGAAIGYFVGGRYNRPVVGALIGGALAGWLGQQVFESQMGRNSVLDHLRDTENMSLRHVATYGDRYEI